MLDYKISEFKKQVAAGVPFAVGSDVGPFPHGTQARELTLMVQYGMKPLAVLQADLINGAKLLGWAGQIGELKPGYFADIIAVPGNPLEDISTCEHVSFVMKDGEGVAAIVRQLTLERTGSLASSILAAASVDEALGLAAGASESSTALRYPPR